MKNGSRAFLIDTNVLVYAYDPSNPLKQERAIAVLKQVADQMLGAVSAQILGEFFVAVTQKIRNPLTRLQAERSLTNYVRSWVVYDLTELVVLEAVRGVRRHQLSYWDSLIWATATMNGVPNVLSQDFRHGALIEGVRSLNPFLEEFDFRAVSAPAGRPPSPRRS
ncbi:MAG: twitching motility protein PilT [Gemmatimonadales bacterium]|nr:MAG: twitching motility protein PilT [Gemmatimonadales bacterium]